MDEVDGMSGNADRGGMQELIQIIKVLMTIFFHSEKSGRSSTAAPDKIFTQTFFQGIEEG